MARLRRRSGRTRLGKRRNVGGKRGGDCGREWRPKCILSLSQMERLCLVIGLMTDGCCVGVSRRRFAVESGSQSTNSSATHSGIERPCAAGCIGSTREPVSGEL